MPMRGVGPAGPGTFAFNVSGADPFWITSGPLAGKWSILSFAHYLEVGTLATDPVPFADLANQTGTYQFVDGKTFGNKTGQTETATCEIVSRWKAGTVGPTDLTIFAPLLLARAN